MLVSFNCACVCVQVKRKLDLDNDHQYISTTRPPPPCPAPPPTPGRPRGTHTHTNPWDCCISFWLLIMLLATLQGVPGRSAMLTCSRLSVFSPSAEHGEITLWHVSEPHHQALPGPARSVSRWCGGLELGLAGAGRPEKTHLRHHQRPRGYSSHLQEIQEQHSVAVSVGAQTHSCTHTLV